jgi:putative hydrolase of the HAD superfamily
VTIEAVLFDFGGVLADSPFEAFARYEAAHGLPDGFIRALNASNPDDNAWARLERNELDFAAFCAVFEAEARDAGGEVDAAELFSGITGSLRPAMVEVVRRCRPALRTGLLTNNFVTSVPRPAHAELFDLFDVVVESSVVGVRKPDPRFYLLACEALGIEPAAAVFLDDLGVNLKAARQLGMVTIKVTQDVTEAVTALESVIGISLS